MKRVVIRVPGGHDALEIVDSDDPSCGPGQVRVRVRAAGINYADTIVREGWYEAAKGKYPLTPGFEFAGVVDESNSPVFKPGDWVFGFARFGGYSSIQVVDASHLRPIPSGWSFEDCAGVPAVHFTAYHALHKVAHVAAGETVLIHSAAGGVGTALLQQAKLAGCKTVGVVGSSAKASVARSFGADSVVIRGDSLWKDIDAIEPHGFDAIFDANGVTTPRPGFERLKLGGRLVIYGFAEMFPRGARPSKLSLAWSWFKVPLFNPLKMTAANRSVAGFNVVFLTDKAELAKDGFDAILGWMRDGSLKKAPVSAFPVERAADAHRALETGDTVGKLVLTFPA